MTSSLSKPAGRLRAGTRICGFFLALVTAGPCLWDVPGAAQSIAAEAGPPAAANPGPAGDGAGEKAPFIIHYCLNDSHGDGWVGLAADGSVGVVHFRHTAGSHADGTLLFRETRPDGGVSVETVAVGTHLEKSVLLYDAASGPHIFVATSDDANQVITHYSRDDGTWRGDPIANFYNEGGRFIYEISAASGPDGARHLLVLKTRSNIDSSDFLWAWMDANLYHLTDASGAWTRDLIRHHHTAYTYDMCIKATSRQDIAVDADGAVHVVYSEQMGDDAPSRLCYATNRSGAWVSETALTYRVGSFDDAGWFPSLALDGAGGPHIACVYVKRVPTLSAQSCKLYYLSRASGGTWLSEIIAERNDGYYGSDGPYFTGALCQLVIDSADTPHVVFSDIAASHWDYQRENIGNVRYGVRRTGVWTLETVYRQPLPAGFFAATEMYGMCMVISEATDTIRIVGQELVVTGQDLYSSELVDFERAWGGEPSAAAFFRAERRHDGVCLSWSSLIGEPSAAVEIWRQGDGRPPIRIFSEPIPVGGEGTCVDREAPSTALRYRLAVVTAGGTRSWFGSAEVPAADPNDDGADPVRLLAPFPNPGCGATDLGYELKRADRVRLSVFDLRGRLVRRIQDETQPAGRHTVRWDGCDERGRAAPAGSYIVDLETGYGTRSLRVVLVR